MTRATDVGWQIESEVGSKFEGRHELAGVSLASASFAFIMSRGWSPGWSAMLSAESMSDVCGASWRWLRCEGKWVLAQEPTSDSPARFIDLMLQVSAPQASMQHPFMAPHTTQAS